MTLITKTSFDLLDQLVRNNTKDWYDAHKNDIKTHCLVPFGEMLEHVSNRLLDSDRPLEGSAKTVFRMHRDEPAYRTFAAHAKLGGWRTHDLWDKTAKSL